MSDFIQRVNNISAHPRTKTAKITVLGMPTPEYFGEHKNPFAATSNAEWRITKYKYDDTGFQTDSQTLVGSWDNRASAGYTI